MGFNLKKAVKSAAKSVVKVVGTPVRVLEKTAKGDLSGATKEWAKGAGEVANAATLRLGQNKDFQKFLRNKTLNTLTLGSGTEIAKLQKGFGQLSKKGEADKEFYQSAMSLTGKAVGGYVLAASAPALAAKSASIAKAITLKQAGTAVVAGSLLSKGKAGQALEQYGVPSELGSQFDRSPGSAAPEYSSQDQDYYNEAQSDSSQNQLLVLGLLGVGAYYAIKG